MLKATTLKANGDLGKIVQYEDRRFRERLHSMKTDDKEEKLHSMKIENGGNVKMDKAQIHDILKCKMYIYQEP